MSFTTADFSARYVAPAGSPLPGNLAALWAVDAELARRVEREEPYPVEPSRAGAGEPTVAVPTADGRQIYLHSRHRPMDEARRLVETAKTESCVAFYLQGLGLGYGLKLLFEKLSEEGLICVLEPDVRLTRTAFEVMDLSAAIRSGRVLFFPDEEKGDLLGRLQNHGALLTLGFEAVSHAPSLQRYPDYHRRMQAALVEVVTFYRTSLQTLLINGRRTSENLARNIGWYAASPGVGRLKGRYAGKPAIIVSAGPSLRKNKHLLKDAAGKAVLIAVQTTLKPMLEMGVEPDFVTSLDYSEISTRFFENLPAGMRTELVAEPKATDRIFDLHPGHVSLLGNDFAEGLVREMKLHRTGLPAGATVAHLSFYLAQHLGCDPIIFVGQDLGFSDGLCYAPGTSYEEVWAPELSAFCTLEMKQWEQIVRDRSILRKAEDVHGHPIYTEERLFAYLQQFERDFAQSSAKVIDATEGGVKKAHTTILSLREAIEQYCTTPLPPRREDHGGYQWGRLPKVMECLKSRRSEARRIVQLSERTLPMLKELRDVLSDGPAANAIIARLDAARQEITPLMPTLELILSLSQTSELRKYQADRLIAAARLEGVELQRRQVQRDIDNVASVITAAEEFAKLMEDVIETLQARVKKEQVAA